MKHMNIDDFLGCGFATLLIAASLPALMILVWNL